jgi:hypothetical protein
MQDKYVAELDVARKPIRSRKSIEGGGVNGRFSNDCILPIIIDVFATVPRDEYSV